MRGKSGAVDRFGTVSIVRLRVVAGDIGRFARVVTRYCATHAARIIEIEFTRRNAHSVLPGVVGDRLGRRPSGRRDAAEDWGSSQDIDTV